MIAPAPGPGQPRQNLLILATPTMWPCWPYLPVLRSEPGGPDRAGVLFDALHALGRPGYSSTVFLTDVFSLPECPEDLLALPKEVFDTPEELAAAGWRFC